MTLTLALLIASLALNIACFFVIASLLDKRRASYEDNDEAGA